VKDLKPLEDEIKALIVSALRLEDVSPGDIQTDAPIFGGGLALDSIDALELGVALQKRFGVKMTQDPEENRRCFASVRSLAAFVASQTPGDGTAAGTAQ
jgi:acyl carrier protein